MLAPQKCVCIVIIFEKLMFDSRIICVLLEQSKRQMDRGNDEKMYLPLEKKDFLVNTCSRYRLMLCYNGYGVQMLRQLISKLKYNFNDPPPLKKNKKK